jgi:TPP-dependent pyruvate/acetoin dehydrogenase alpha subunit
VADSARLTPAPPAVHSELGLQMHRWMVLSRVLEDRLFALWKQGRIRGRLLTGRGQEAIPTAAALAVNTDDFMCIMHRDMAAHLIRGTTAETVMLHYFGKATGPSGGRDGDIHFAEWERRNFPMVSHLPDSFPVALGLALTSLLRKDRAVTVAFCGEGSTSVGAWHETLNFASVFRCPNVFVVENNQYAYSTPADRQYRGRLVDRALGYGIRGECLDGNDVLAMHEAMVSAIARAREGEGPTLIEAMTMRMDGHAGHDDAAYVPDELKALWRARDPIERLELRLREEGAAPALLERNWSAAREEVDAAVESAWGAPDPTAADLLTRGVFADPA